MLLHRLQVAIEHRVHLVAEREPQVRQLLLGTAVGKVAIVLPGIAFPGELPQLGIAWMLRVPLLHAACGEVVLVVLPQFADTGARHVQQLELHLGRGLAVLRTLHDVLLSGPCRLHHLVHGAVAVERQEAAAEHHGELVKRVGLAVKVQILPAAAGAHHVQRLHTLFCHRLSFRI